MYICNVDAMSKKRAKLERQYVRVKKEITRERPYLCQGCGCRKRLTFSHRIPRSRDIILLADKENIDLYCLECHEIVEEGRYSELMNGASVADYVRRIDPAFYQLQIYKDNQQFTLINPDWI